MSNAHDFSGVLEPFVEEGWISEIIGTLTSGKEGTVYCCQADVKGRSAGHELIAAKVFRPREHRTFRNDAIYQEGRGLGPGKPDKRLERAFAKKSKAGLAGQYRSWIAHEFATLRLLHGAGAAVPEPLAQSEHAILMEYIGDRVRPAPLLQHAEIDHNAGPRLFRSLMADIRLWLAWGRVHADLSSFNILYWDGKLTVIDFPQAVDPETSPNARALLGRDIDNVCRFFSRHGVQADANRLTADLWRRYQRLEL